MTCVGRNLHQNVTDVQNGQTCRILCVVDAEILLQTTKTRSSDVVAVEVVHDVDQHEQRASRIKLALQLLLNLSPPLRAQIGGDATVGRLGRNLVALGVHLDIFLDVGHFQNQTEGVRPTWERQIVLPIR